MTKPYKCRVEYLESSKTQYIDTGVALTANSTLDFNFSPNEQSTLNLWICGSYTTNSKLTGFRISSSSSLQGYIDGTSSISVSESNVGKKYHCVMNSTNWSVNGTDGSSATQAAGRCNLTIFGWNSSPNTSAVSISGKCSAKVYNFKISDNGTLVRDFIPVLDNSGRPAMYDQVSGQLFYNQGSGEFTYGRQIIPVEYLESTGEQYIDTGLKGKNGYDFDYKFNSTRIDSTAYGIGGEWENGKSCYLGLIRDTNYFGYHYQNTSSAVQVQLLTANTDYRVQAHLYSGEQYYILNGTKSAVGTITGTFTSTSNMRLFSIYSSTPLYSYIKMYYCKIWDNGVLVRDFIPCIDENLTPFMFDKVNCTVYLNAGTGQFKVGSNVEKVWGGKKLRRKLALALANLKKPRKYYCEVEYLEGTGTQYIDTGLDYFADFEISIKLRTSVSNKALGNGAFYCMQRYNQANPYWYFSTGTGTSNSYITSTPITEHHIMKWKDNKIYSDGVLLTDFTKDSNAPNRMYLYSGDGGNKYPNMIYFCKLWNPDNGELVRDFIPVLDWDMKPCMYDKVTEQLFYNQGTGDFIAGREIHPVDYLESTGEQYIDTGIKSNLNTSAEMNLNVVAYSTNNTASFFGGLVGNVGISTNISKTNTDRYSRFGTKYTVIKNLDIEGIKSTITIDKNAFVINGESYAVGETSSFNGPNMYLFKVYGIASGYNTTTDVYSCKLWDNGVLVRDYIPAIDENGVGFMFDRVSHTCFLNQGTGTFKYPAREVEYLKSDGGPYIDTGIQPTDDYGYKIRNTYTRGGGEQCAIGCMDTGNRFVGIYTSGAENQLSGAWGSFVGFLPTYAWATGDILDVEVNYKNSRKMIVNGTELKDISDIHISGTVSNTIYLFARHYGSTITKMKGNVYGVEITNGQNIVADFIPAFKDGQIGMYDKVSGVLKTNTGTGSFSKGKIVEPEYE